MLLRRFMGNMVKPSLKSMTLGEYKQDPVKMIIIPVNQEKLFIYFKHDASLRNKDSRIQSTENWLVTKSAKLWKKLVESPKPYNQKIVKWVKKALDQIKWQEASFLTIPGESYILKRVLSKDLNKPKDGNFSREITITSSQYKNLQPRPKIKPLNVYYPLTKTWNPDSILKELQNLSKEGITNHRKKMLRDLSLIPLTLPIALVPLIPNIPGFYLVYRAYCNFKAYTGARHLDLLLKKHIESKKSWSVQFRELKPYSDLLNQNINNITLDEKTLDELLALLDIREMRSALIKSIKQENAIQQNHKPLK